MRLVFVMLTLLLTSLSLHCYGDVKREISPRIRNEGGKIKGGCERVRRRKADAEARHPSFQIQSCENGRLYLRNGLAFEVSSSSQNTVKKWMAGQQITLENGESKVYNIRLRNSNTADTADVRRLRHSESTN